MSGCCLYCKHAGAGWISTKNGSINVDKHDDFYRAMNIYCNNPVTGMDGQCFQISFVRCSFLNVQQMNGYRNESNFIQSFRDSGHTQN